jgi:hypothetical protein
MAIDEFDSASLGGFAAAAAEDGVFGWPSPPAPRRGERRLPVDDIVVLCVEERRRARVRRDRVECGGRANRQLCG